MKNKSNLLKMAKNTKIQWSDHTLNLWWGCSKVNAGCKNCYAETLSKRFDKESIWGEKAPRKDIKSKWRDLSKFQREAQNDKVIRKVFVGSMMDIFEDSKPLVDHLGNPVMTYDNKRCMTGDVRQAFFNSHVHMYPNLFFLLLTKRPENVVKMIPESWLHEPPKNIAVGVSVANQETLKEVIPKMGDFPAHMNTFLSVEPMIEKIDLSETYECFDEFMGQGTLTTPFFAFVKWVICGGESGDNKRPFDISWANDLYEQCKQYSIPFFMKQIDKVQPVPPELQIREFPKYCNKENIYQFEF